MEPGDETEASSATSPTKRVSRNLEQLSSNGETAVEEELLPLPENTLTRNLGLDLIVVLTKVGIRMFILSIAVYPNCFPLSVVSYPPLQKSSVPALR